MLVINFLSIFKSRDRSFDRGFKLSDQEVCRRDLFFGSFNIIISDRPLPGETMTMSAKKIAGGGKGANQAIAAARSGAQTAFIGKVGSQSIL